MNRVTRLQLPGSIQVSLFFIEDSSTDRTRDVLRNLARERDDIRYCCLARGFGQGPAIVFGISRCMADAYVMMDADGSHPPEAIPEMVLLWNDGAAAVQCVRRTLPNRKSYRWLGTALFQFLARYITGVDTRQQNIFYRLISKQTAEELLRQPRYWRWLRLPLPASTRVLEIDTAERIHGESKYGPRRLAMLAIDGVLSVTPPHRLGALLAAGIVLTGAAYRYSVLLALFIAIPLAWLTWHYRTAAGENVLLRMKVTESGNLPCISKPSDLDPSARALA